MKIYPLLTAFALLGAVGCVANTSEEESAGNGDEDLGTVEEAVLCYNASCTINNGPPPNAIERRHACIRRGGGAVVDYVDVCVRLYEVGDGRRLGYGAMKASHPDVHLQIEWLEMDWFEPSTGKLTGGELALYYSPWPEPVFGPVNGRSYLTAYSPYGVDPEFVSATRPGRACIVYSIRWRTGLLTDYQTLCTSFYPYDPTSF